MTPRSPDLASFPLRPAVGPVHRCEWTQTLQAPNASTVAELAAWLDDELGDWLRAAAALVEFRVAPDLVTGILWDAYNALGMVREALQGGCLPVVVNPLTPHVEELVLAAQELGQRADGCASELPVQTLLGGALRGLEQQREADHVA